MLKLSEPIIAFPRVDCCILHHRISTSHGDCVIHDAKVCLCELNSKIKSGFSTLFVMERKLSSLNMMLDVYDIYQFKELLLFFSPCVAESFMMNG